MKTKTSLQVHFQEKLQVNFHFCHFFPHGKKTKFARIVQLTILRKRTHVASELFYFYVPLAVVLVFWDIYFGIYCPQRTKVMPPD